MPSGVDEQRLVLLSGGLDSTTLLANLALESPAPQALYVDYGQPAAARELAAAQSVCAAYSIRLVETSVSGVSIASNGEIPGRNSLLVMIGLMNVTADRAIVLLAIHAGTGYADCTPAFVDAQQRILDLYTGGAVVLSAPFINWSKADVWALGRRLSIPTELTYSCERGLTQPCGNCRSCGDLEALHEAS